MLPNPRPLAANEWAYFSPRAPKRASPDLEGGSRMDSLCCLCEVTSKGQTQWTLLTTKQQLDALLYLKGPAATNRCVIVSISGYLDLGWVGPKIPFKLGAFLDGYIFDFSSRLEADMDPDEILVWDPDPDFPDLLDT